MESMLNYNLQGTSAASPVVWYVSQGEKILQP